VSFASYLIGPCIKMSIVTKQQLVAPFKPNIRDLMLLSIFFLTNEDEIVYLFVQVSHFYLFDKK